MLSREVNGLPLAYLDSAASAQKPSQVIDSEAEVLSSLRGGASRYSYLKRPRLTEKMETR
ncbi:aminotransferase class V-fold PLP-dependent enzyme [Escherichia coli]